MCSRQRKVTKLESCMAAEYHTCSATGFGNTTQPPCSLSLPTTRKGRPERNARDASASEAQSAFADSAFKGELNQFAGAASSSRMRGYTPFSS